MNRRDQHAKPPPLVIDLVALKPVMRKSHDPKHPKPVPPKPDPPK